MPQPTQPPAGPPPGAWAGNQPVRYQSHNVRRARDVGAPLALIVIGAILIGILALLSAATSLSMFAIGVIPSTLALVIGLSAYMWLDQWEPEPPRLLLVAFIWGGGIATAGALLIGLFLSIFGIMDDPVLGAVVQAPIVEEGLKGAFLLIMLTGVRRREMRTLVDHLVYAGFVGFGFAFVENLLYFAGAETLSDTVFMAIIRTGFNMFGHSFYTSAIAVGIYLGRKHQGSTRKLYYIGGFVIAMLLHAAWNGAAVLLGGLGLIAVYFLVLTPAFIALVVQGVKARKREGQVIASQLPRMVNEGLITHQEAQWISVLSSRAAIRKQLKGQDAQLARANSLIEAVAELAIIRDRSMGEPSQFEQHEEAYLVQAIMAERQFVPANTFAGAPPAGAAYQAGQYPATPPAGPAGPSAPGYPAPPQAAPGYPAQSGFAAPPPGTPPAAPGYPATPQYPGQQPGMPPGGMPGAAGPYPPR